MLAVIFRTCSVELGVDAHASEEQVEGMGEAERRKVWGTVKAEVEALMREKMTMLFTMQLREGKVGLRVCRRGEERFPF